MIHQTTRPPKIAPIEQVFRGSFADDTIDGTPEDDGVFSDSGGRGHDPILGNPGRDLGDRSLGRDRMSVWGGDSRADARADGAAEDDILGAVTGASARTGGRGGDGFYLLANASDDQLTEVTVADFDPRHDRLTLTMDQLEDAVCMPEVDVMLTETTVEGVSGVRVDVVFSGPEDGVPQSESAAAFLQGVTVEDLGPANITAVVTTAGDLFDGEAALLAR